MMAFDWRAVPGFGAPDFEGFYRLIVEAAPPGSLLIEVGVYHGRSLIQLAQEAFAADKGLRVVGVDWGREPTREHRSFASCAHQNLIDAGIADRVPLVIAPSVEAAELFECEAAWMVFLDAAHTPHEAVAADIDAWMPVASNWLAGHDAKWFTVIEAAQARLHEVHHDLMWPNVWLAPRQQLDMGADIHKPTTIPQAGREFSDFRGVLLNK